MLINNPFINTNIHDLNKSFSITFSVFIRAQSTFQQIHGPYYYYYYNIYYIFYLFFIVYYTAERSSCNEVNF